MVGTLAGERADSPPEEAEEEKKEEEKRKKKKVPTKRRPLTPTRTETIPIPDEERPCPECGEARETAGKVSSIVVEYVPARVEVIEYLREKVACRHCEGHLTVAPPPKERVVERALPGPQLLSALVTEKVCDGLPLRRVHKRLKRAGLDIPLRTLNRWESFAHQILLPLIRVIKQKVLGSEVINLDDTGLRVQDPTLKGKTWSGHVWVFIGRQFDPGGDLRKTKEFVFYKYAETWEARHPEAFLDGCSAAIQGDAYRGFERIADANRGDHVGKILAGCAMHARRPFVQALEANDPIAFFFVERFKRIYRVEEEARKDHLLAHERLEKRKADSLPIMEEIYERARQLSSVPLIKPMKSGVTYFVNQWQKLIVPFTLDGRLEIDNGLAERRLRNVAHGRRAWLFAGSHDGASRYADVLSLVGTGDAAGVDLGHYLPSIMANINTWPNQRIEELLPHNWQAFYEDMLAQHST